MLTTGLQIVATPDHFDGVRRITLRFYDLADDSSFTATLAFMSERSDRIRGPQTLNVAAGNHPGFIHAAATDTGLSIVIEDAALARQVAGVSFADPSTSTAAFANGLTFDVASLRSNGAGAIRVKGNHTFPHIGYAEYPTIGAVINYGSRTSTLRFIFTLRTTEDQNSAPTIGYRPVTMTLPAISLRVATTTSLTLTVTDLNIETPTVWVDDPRFTLAQVSSVPFSRVFALVAKNGAVFSRDINDIELVVATEDDAGARDSLTQTISFRENDTPILSVSPARGFTLTANLFNNLDENKATGVTINVEDEIPVQGGFAMKLVGDDRFELVLNQSASRSPTFKYDLRVRSGSSFSRAEDPMIFLTISAEDSEGAASNIVSYGIAVEELRIDVGEIHKEVLPVITREILNVNSQHLEDHIATLRPRQDGSLVLGLDDASVQVVRDMILRKSQGLEEGDLNLAEFLDGQSFALPLAQNAGGDLQLGFWGRGEYSAIEQKEDDELTHTFDGSLLSGSLGVEAVSDAFAFGVGMGYHSGEFEIKGDVELNDADDRNWIDYDVGMYTVNPYVAAFLGDDGKAWLALTYGQGEVDLVEGLECTERNAADCSIGYDHDCDAGDGRCRFVDNGTLESVGFSIGGIGDLLALADADADAGSLHLKLQYSQHASEYSNEDGDNVLQPVKIEGIESRAARLGLEYEVDIESNGSTVTPSFAAYIRSSSDTAGRGKEDKSSSGFESVLGMSFAAIDFPISLGVKGRFLRVNELNAVGGHLDLAFGGLSANRGLGLSFSLRPSYGGLGTGEQLFEVEELADLAVPGGSGLRMGSEVAYGMAVPYGLFTPYGSYQVKPNEDNEYVLGMNYSHGGFSRIGVSMLGFQGKEEQDLKVEYYLDFQE